jgi:hypothetical protein
MKHNYLKFKFIGLFLLALLVMNFAQAQQVITGTVIDDATGEGLPGVNVLVKGITTGPVTDANGQYSLSADEIDLIINRVIPF